MKVMPILSAPPPAKVGDIIRINTTDRSRHPLCNRNRTGEIVGITYRENGKPQSYDVRLHCTTTDDKAQFSGTIAGTYIPALGYNVGVLKSCIINLPKSYCDVVRGRNNRNHIR